MKSLLIVVQLVLCSWWVAALPAELELSPNRVGAQLKAPTSELQTAEERTATDLSASDEDAATSELVEETSEESIAEPESQDDASESAEEDEEETSEELIMPEVHGGAPESQGETPESAEDKGNNAQFVGLLPDAMFSAIQGESEREDEQQAATVDEEQLLEEAEELRSAEFVSDIVMAMDGTEE
ncbi:hypothetical protein H4S08_001481 [Coemansia sp. RSA 1365]|nr:hypothetical protein H4S08_001481 [Coemansia sp. RSA 1365]